MRLTLGAHDETWGELTLTDGKITVTSGDEAHLRAVLDLIRNPDESDADLFARLPQVLDSPYAWAVPDVKM
jgi:hypothetical protein